MFCLLTEIERAREEERPNFISLRKLNGRGKGSGPFFPAFFARYNRLLDEGEKCWEFPNDGSGGSTRRNWRRNFMLYMVIPIISELDPKFPSCEQKKRKDGLSNITPLLVGTFFAPQIKRKGYSIVGERVSEDA